MEWMNQFRISNNSVVGNCAHPNKNARSIKVEGFLEKALDC
jgi:hypothetical protein